MFDEFVTYETKPKTNLNDNGTAKIESKPALTNISALFKQAEYKDKLTSLRDLVKVSEILERPLIITGYKEDTMTDIHTGNDKPCFRMDFKFADDPEEIPHYIRTEARYLWDHLKVVNEVNPDLLNSGTLVAMICEGKQNNKTKTKFYYFEGTMNPSNN